jgi:hypothetical protein
MNLQGLMTARELLLKAVEDGPVKKPAAVQKILRALPSLATAASMNLNTVALVEQVSAQFFIREVLHGEQAVEPEQAERWVNALRWALQELRSWTPDTAHAFLHLRILLAVLAAFDSVHAEIGVISEKFTTSSLPKGLLYLLEHAEIKNVGENNGLSSLWSEIQVVSLAGDYERLATLRRHFGMDIPLPPDIRLAIFLIWRMKPRLLAKHIDQKKDAFLSYGVCGVLGDSALPFALGVDDVTFKFFSAAALADMQPEHASRRAVNVFRKLLLQVARSHHWASWLHAFFVFRKLLLQVARSHHWASWLHAFFKYPDGNRVSELALPNALAQLESKQWADFLNAVQLWTHLATVAPVTDILVRF